MQRSANNTLRTALVAAALSMALGLLVTANAPLAQEGAPAAISEDDMLVHVSSDAFPGAQRPASLFGHDFHTDAQGLDDCALCHHSYDDAGNLVPDEDTAGTPCADCHTLEDQGSRPGLMEAFHRQCQSCHAERGAGPVACGECHRKE